MEEESLTLFKAKDLKEKLSKAMMEGIECIVFCNIEGSPLAQVTNDRNKSSTYSAVISNIFYEYVELGQQVFNGNHMNSIIIENDGGTVMASNVYTHVLFFILEKDV